ncbi:tunnelling fold family protein [Streptomyces scopuliridis]|uniref:hypothetical protein n=1 Tax=Streptomyces scopuliridis TaxID=452529 RepID=UPI00389AD54B
MVHETAGIVLAAAEDAARDFLNALGASTDSESMQGAPGRMVRAHAELVLARAIPVRCRPRVRERLTKRIADWLRSQLDPKGVGVISRPNTPA